MRRQAALHLVLAALVLRTIVPGGVMPADTSSGWFLQLCPDGLPAAVMAALLDDPHHHHHHETADNAYQQCDLSAGAGAIHEHAPTLEVAEGEFSSTYRIDPPRFAEGYRVQFATRPRAPPLSLIKHHYIT